MNLENVRTILRSHEPGAVGKYRYFSVLVPFVEKEGKLYLLYEMRARHMVSQPGEICFPGGHMEEHEDPETCALRETEEEIGIPRGRIELIGRGNTLYGNANFSLFTFIGAVSYEDYKNIHLQEEEVDHVFLVDADRLLHMKPELYIEKMKPVIPDDFPYDRIGIGKDYRWFTNQTDVPVYDIDGTVIWGITARITKDLMETLRKKGNL